MKTKLFYLIIVSLLVSGCNSTNVSETSSINIPTDYSFVLNNFESEVNFHTEEQTTYIKGNYDSVPFGNMGERSRPKPTNLSWSFSFENGCLPTNFSIHVSEDNLFSSNITYITNEQSLDIYNLKINTTYYWKVVANYSDGVIESEVSSFNTSNEKIRNLYIDGVTNARDLGDGVHIKQGLLYRCAELNDKDGNILVSEQGCDAVKNHLKIKSEVDLRRDKEFGNIVESPVNGVDYYRIPMLYGGMGNILTGKEVSEDINNPSQINKFFNFLADANNYPIMYHCTYGKDRTGFLSYLINGLMGVEIEDIYKDYLFTLFSDTSNLAKVDDIAGKPTSYYPNVINKYNGDTLSEKIYNYLTDDGLARPAISKDTLDAVIKNLKA